MNRILKNWKLSRAIRLLVGALVIYEGIRTEQWLIAVLGFVFAAMALWNVGCTNDSCAIPRSKKTL